MNHCLYRLLLYHYAKRAGGQTNLFKEHGHNDEAHETISSNYGAWKEVRIFGPEFVGEEAWPAVLRS
jgi:hypothetical protein